MTGPPVVNRSMTIGASLSTLLSGDWGQLGRSDRIGICRSDFVIDRHDHLDSSIGTGWIGLYRWIGCLVAGCGWIGCR